ncbi:hypothetical protein [Nocardia callitridis]|uniref:Uncharacterized protein n=1 Tax=Nocardia callitridis TaxID=648753 RepID=A0ABP9L2Y0_9NOCA
MTQFNVDPLIYALSGSNLHTYAVDFHHDFSTYMTNLADITEMGGTARGVQGLVELLRRHRGGRLSPGRFPGAGGR